MEGGSRFTCHQIFSNGQKRKRKKEYIHFKLEFNFVANETAILVTHTYHVQAHVAENFTAKENGSITL